MKFILTTLLLACTFLQSYGQTVKMEDFDKLLPYLEKEDWKPAFKESSRLLETVPKDTSFLKGVVTYINIFSAAGMVTKGEMTFKELEKNIMQFKGQKIIMPGHPVTTKEGALSQTLFEVSDSKNEAFTSAANADGVNIFCFEKFYFKEKINLKEFPENSIVQCGGILDKIEINPSPMLLWISRLTVKDAFAQKLD